jgi:general secretion pathway protein G
MNITRPYGFTLIEMLVTVAIVALLALIALPLTSVVAQHRKEEELRMALREMRLAIDAYKQAVEDGRIAKAADQSGYPPSLRILVDGVVDAKVPGGKKKIYFLREIPRDPMSEAVSGGGGIWTLRSYASPTDNPSPGKDVFDVHSMSREIGLNGIPYNKW